MKKCNSCNILFNTNEKLCPLCQNKLLGNSKSVFPINYRYKTVTMINKIILFLSISIAIICSFIDLLLNSQITWSFVVILVLITNHIVTQTILRSYKDTLSMLGKYGVVIMIILFIWYFYTKNTIITNYIIPAVCIAELLFTAVLSIILRNSYVLRYIRLILLNIFISIIPTVLVLFNLTTYNILAYIASIISLLVLTALIIFYYEELKDELNRIFNI